MKVVSEIAQEVVRKGQNSGTKNPLDMAAGF